jgi:cell division protein ZapA (FtsZ GTPase activity inhibitor)
MNRAEPTVVIVTIAGEEYTLRADATPEYTRQCADYLDHMIREIRAHAGALEAHRAAILAGLALADQLFQARASADAEHTGVSTTLAQLRIEIEARLAAPDLAATS